MSEETMTVRGKTVHLLLANADEYGGTLTNVLHEGRSLGLVDFDGYQAYRPLLQLGRILGVYPSMEAAVDRLTNAWGWDRVEHRSEIHPAETQTDQR